MRIVSRVVLTVAGLSVLAAGWRAGEAPFAAADLQAVASTSTTASSPVTGSGSGATTQSSPTQSIPTPSTTPTPAAEASAAVSGTYAGPAIDTRYGTMRVQVIVEAGVVTDVQTLQSGLTDSKSQRINASAIPALVGEVVDAQTWDVSYVSGASYTSEGILGSVEGALADAGLA